MIYPQDAVVEQRGQYAEEDARPDTLMPVLLPEIHLPDAHNSTHGTTHFEELDVVDDNSNPSPLSSIQSGTTHAGLAMSR